MNTARPTQDSGKIADFIIFSQREFLLSLSKELGHMKITFCQFYFLCHLTVQTDLNMGDVAKKIGISTAAACGFVDQLQKFGFAKREHDLQDRRRILVNITEKGRAFVSDLRLSIQNLVAEAMEKHENSNIDDFLNEAGR